MQNVFAHRRVWRHTVRIGIQARVEKIERTTGLVHSDSSNFRWRWAVVFSMAQQLDYTARVKWSSRQRLPPRRHCGKIAAGDARKELEIIKGAVVILAQINLLSGATRIASCQYYRRYRL